MKITKVMTYLLSIVVLISIAIEVNGCMSEQDEILEYLEEKYGQQFEVERYWLEYDGSSKQSFNTLVHPIGQTNIPFAAGKFWDKKAQGYVIWDNYVTSKWSVDFTKQHYAEIDELDARPTDVKFNIAVVGEPEAKYLNKSIVDYVRAGERESESSVTMAVAVKCNEAPQEDKEAQYIFNIYEIVKQYGFDRFFINVVFVKAEAYTDAQKMLDLYHATSDISVEDIGRDNYYRVVRLSFRDEIVSLQDVSRRLKIGGVGSDIRRNES